MSNLFSLDMGIESFAKRVKGEREKRLAQAAKMLGFGVMFLDAALGGIFCNDLILLGAKTGAGKTELAATIAMHNAKQKKRVHYFALEAEPDEIERRIKYKLISQIAYEFLGPRLNYFDWYMGKLDKQLDKFEQQIDAVLADQYSTLFTFYRKSDFRVDDLEKKLLAIQDTTDLAIIDHLHYVDTDDDNENRGYKQIVKRVRDTALAMGKPVIVIAHIRKAERKMKAIIPDIEDFHGTSDIPKIATKAIMISPVEATGDEPHIWGTYMQGVKCRFDGSRTRYLAQVNYNARTSAYEDKFTLGRAINLGQVFEPVPEFKLPRWAQQSMDRDYADRVAP
jgi:replicative DNA helicase